MANPEKNIGGALKFIKGAMIGTIIASVSMTYAFDASVVEASSKSDSNTIEVASSENVNYNVSVASLAKSKFKDVRADHYSYDAINWAQAKGIIHGYPDGTFKPHNTVTEGQFVKMVSEYFGLKGNGEKIVKNGGGAMWHDVYYDRLAAHGAPVNGYFDNATRNSVVKRGTVAQTLAYLGGYSMNLSESINFLLDNKVTVGQNSAYKNDLYKYFGTQNDLSRAQVVTFLYRMNNNDLTKVGVNAESMFNNSSEYTLNQAATIGKNKIDKSLAKGPKSNTGGNVVEKPAVPGIDFGNGVVPGKPGNGAVDDFSDYNINISKSAGKGYLEKGALDYFINKLGSSNTEKYLRHDKIKVYMATSDSELKQLIVSEEGHGVSKGIVYTVKGGEESVSFGPGYKQEGLDLFNSMYGYNLNLSNLKYGNIDSKVRYVVNGVSGGGNLVIKK